LFKVAATKLPGRQLPDARRPRSPPGVHRLGSGEKGWETKVFTGKTDNIGDGPDRIPFLNPTLTRATSRGVPIGHICRWWGEEGSGKSLTDLGIIYVAQNYPRS
jgi:hypothetical protein